MNEELHKELFARSKAEPYARLLGIEPKEIGEGRAVVRMAVNPGLENIFGVTHGGAVFSLIDEAFQLACNTHGSLAVALNVSVTYMAAPGAAADLEATAVEKHKTRRTATYMCEVHDTQDGRLIAVAQALAYRTGKEVAGSSV